MVHSVFQRGLELCDTRMKWDLKYVRYPQYYHLPHFQAHCPLIYVVYKVKQLFSNTGQSNVFFTSYVFLERIQ